MSAATTASAPCSLLFAMNARGSTTRPSVSGYWTTVAKTFVAKSNVAASPTMTSMPSASARVRTTSMVAGLQPLETKIAFRSSEPLKPYARCIASAAAVASSRSEALAISRPVRSETIVW